MGHFAEIKDGIVVRVIVAEQDFIDSGAVGDPSAWLRTSYNTRGGIHYDPQTGLPSEDQSKAFRKNFAGCGGIYDANRDAFINAKPFPSWVLDEQTCWWMPPVPKPEDDKYYLWNESELCWVEETI